MTIAELDRWMQNTFAPDAFSRIDSSQNGLQVARRGTEIRRIATAVDAAMDVFDAAVAWDADLLFVHHGLFWGREQVVTGPHYARLARLLEADLALYAMHLPLDAHLELGNNAVMAEVLGLREVSPFGLIRGIPIGVEGKLAEPTGVDAIVDRLFGAETPLAVLPFGPSQIRSVGIISGGAPLEVDQAIDLGLDLYITGDANHIAYHRCREAGINAIFGGHYATETFGVQRVAERLARDFSVETRFLDVPTGL